MFEHLDDPRPPAFDGRFHRAVVDRARRRRRRRRLAGSAGVATASLVAGVGGLYGRAALRAGDIDRVEVAGTGPVAAGEPMTVLVVGTDGPAPGERVGRTDTILLARLDPAAGTAGVMSLPRDLVVEAPGGGGPVRINSIGHEADLVAAVESQVGVPVDHYVEVSMDGFRRLVDRIGGIDVRVDVPVRDTRSGLVLDRTGCVTLDGGQALALVRSRHVEVYDGAAGAWVFDPLSDLRRVETQRQVLIAALASLADQGVGPVAVDRLVDWFVESVVVDAALGRDDLMALAQAALRLDPAEIVQSTLPVVPYPADENRLVADPDRAPAAVRAFLGGTSGGGAGGVPGAGGAELPGGAIVDPCSCPGRAGCGEGL